MIAREILENVALSNLSWFAFEFPRQRERIPALQVISASQVADRCDQRSILKKHPSVKECYFHWQGIALAPDYVRGSCHGKTRTLTEE